MNGMNGAFKTMNKGEVGFRYVIDMSSLAGGG